jgi:hypothetical protein
MLFALEFAQTHLLYLARQGEPEIRDISILAIMLRYDLASRDPTLGP